MNNDSIKSPVLEKNQAAKFLGISVRTLSRMHAEGKGPPRVKYGRRVVYLKDSLMQWVISQEVGPVRC